MVVRGSRCLFIYCGVIPGKTWGEKELVSLNPIRSNENVRFIHTESFFRSEFSFNPQVIAKFEPSERCMLLKFVTSCSRAPLLGFKHLQPVFTIHKVACDVPLWATIGGQDVDRLPSASSCYNTLKLPTYRCANTLRTKLLYAINSNAGLELS